MSWAGVSKNNALQLKPFFPKDIYIHSSMESIQSQWCATRPRSPSIGGLSSGKPLPPRVLRERLGSGGQGSGRQQEGVTQRERADQTAANHHRGSHIFTRSALRAHRWEMQRDLEERQVGRSTLWGRRELRFPACVLPPQGNVVEINVGIFFANR